LTQGSTILKEADAFGRDAVIDVLKEMGEAAAKRR